MNWDAMAAIAEIVASFGVIASLIYLSIQIRHQRAEGVLSAGHELAGQINVAFSGISDNAELASIYLRGMNEYESLDDVEKMRFSALLSRLMRIHETMYSRHREGLLDPIVWPTVDTSMRDFFSHAGLREWWATRCHWFSPEFREFVSGCIADDRGKQVYYTSQ